MENLWCLKGSSKFRKRISRLLWSHAIRKGRSALGRLESWWSVSLGLVWAPSGPLLQTRRLPFAPGAHSLCGLFLLELTCPVVCVFDHESQGAFFFLLKLIHSFFREVLGYQKNWAESTELLYIHLYFSYSSHPRLVWCICYNPWTYQFSSVTHSCPTFGDPMDYSTPRLPVPYQLRELAQTHVHQVSDAIQPSHPLSSPSPPAFNRSQHQGLFQWVSSLHQVAKVLELQLQHQFFQWTLRTDFL